MLQHFVHMVITHKYTVWLNYGYIICPPHLKPCFNEKIILHKIMKFLLNESITIISNVMSVLHILYFVKWRIVNTGYSVWICGPIGHRGHVVVIMGTCLILNNVIYCLFSIFPAYKQKVIILSFHKYSDYHVNKWRMKICIAL